MRCVEELFTMAHRNAHQQQQCRCGRWRCGQRRWHSKDTVSALGLPHHGIEKTGGCQSRGIVGERPGWNAADERERHARGEFGDVGVESAD